jgi:hypothetical protein
VEHVLDRWEEKASQGPTLSFGPYSRRLMRVWLWEVGVW